MNDWQCLCALAIVEVPLMTPRASIHTAITTSSCDKQSWPKYLVRDGTHPAKSKTEDKGWCREMTCHPPLHPRGESSLPRRSIPGGKNAASRAPRCAVTRSPPDAVLYALNSALGAFPPAASLVLPQAPPPDEVSGLLLLTSDSGNWKQDPGLLCTIGRG